MGVKRNFLFSAILTAANYIFPFIIYPYIARVLGVENVGICNYVDSIVSYAVMISAMGILMIGTREIAKATHDRNRLNSTFTSLFLLTLITTIIASAILISVTFCVSKLAPYKPLLLIGLIKLWGNFLLIDWFFRGIEDFKFITVRTIIVKILFLVAVFIFVRNAGDYIVYYLLLCLSMAINAVLNCCRASHLVRFRLDLSSLRHIWKPFMIFGLYMFLNSMYMSFNVLYLGWEMGDVQVGYYTTSTKIFEVILAIYTAYSTVVMPRASALLEEGRRDEFSNLIAKSVDGLMMFAVPVAIFMAIFARGVVAVIAGPEYSGSVVPMMIEMPLLFIIGYEQILVLQILTPMNRDKAILTNSAVGAVVGVTCNLLLVHALASVGSAFAWAVAEVAVLISAQIFVARYIEIHFPWRKLLVNAAAYLPVALLCICMTIMVKGHEIQMMLLGALIFCIYFWCMQHYILKNQIFVETVQRARCFIKDHIKA